MIATSAKRALSNRVFHLDSIMILRIGISILCMSVSVLSINAQRFEQITSFTDSIVQTAGDKGDFPGLTMTITTPYTSKYLAAGFLDFEAKEKVDSLTLFELGSIGKVLTAIAVLQLVDAGELNLMTDINDYLPFEVSNPHSQKPISLSHLLSHTSGLNDKNLGYLARDIASIEPLEEHLKNELPTFYRSHGEEICYSNYAYALAGLIVQKVSQKDFSDYVNENIFRPLYMKNSFIGPLNNEGPIAKGHVIRGGAFDQVKSYPRHTTPAGSLISNARDMKRLLKAMLTRDKQILSAEAWNRLFTSHFRNHDMLNGYSLGLEEQSINGKQAWAKGGMVSGVLSHLLILPDSVGIFLSVNTSKDEFQESFFSKLFDKFYPGNVSPMSALKIDVSSYLGEYRNVRYSREGVESLISLFRGSIEVFESETGNLMLWHNGQMNEYVPVGNDVFQHMNDPEQTIAFESQNGNIAYLMRDINIGGLTIPGKFERLSWYNSPTYINEYYGFILIGIFAYSFALIGCGIIRLIRIWKPGFYRYSFLPLYYYLIGFAIISLTVVHIFQVLVPMIKNPNELLFGWSGPMATYNVSAYLIVVFSGIAFVLMLRYLSGIRGSIVAKLFFGIMTFCAVIHSWTLWYWNFVF